MTHYLDYSAAKLSGATIKAAGYAGAIRYIDDITNPSLVKAKHTNRAEYQDHVAQGLDDYLVIEVGVSDADGGWNRGVELARRALAGANVIGYPAHRPIFFCNDRTTVSSASAWRGFLDGAASVVGRDRTGAYGFANAMDLAVGHASCFWQAGRRSDVRSFVNFWQDNNVQVTVGGITCDRNLVLKPIALVEEEDMNWEQDRRLYNLDRVINATFEDQDTVTGVQPEWPGWATNTGTAPPKIAIDNPFLARVRAVESKVDSLANPGTIQVEVDYDRIINGVVARLNALQFKADAA